MSDATKKTGMSPRELVTFALLIAMYIFLMADSRLMSAIIPELSREYGVDKQALGMIGTAFVLAGAAVGIVIGFWSDRVPRKKLLVAIVLVGEIPCLLTGFEFFTQSLEAFIALRVLTGVGMGGITPITYSLVSDIFREDNRAKAAAGITVAWAIGILMGPSLAGYLTDDYGWRIGFILAAAPNFPLAVLFWFVAKEPTRGASDGAVRAAAPDPASGRPNLRISFADIRKVLRNQTNRAIYLQGLFGTIPWGVTGFWAISYFEETAGLSKSQATTVQNLVGLGAIIGTVVFGILGDRLYRKRPRNVPLMCGAGILLGAVPFAMVFNVSPDAVGLAGFMGIALLGGFLAACAGANIKAILMNVNPARDRGSVFGFLSITDAIGPGLGPFVGTLFFGWFGFNGGMNFSILWWIPCALAFFAAAAFIEGDRRRARLGGVSADDETDAMAATTATT